MSQVAETEQTTGDPAAFEGLRLEGLTKSFPGFTAVDHLDLDVPSGSFFALLGPSGCGKTTTLRMVAGLDSPTSGSIVLNGTRHHAASGPTAARSTRCSRATRSSRTSTSTRTSRSA